MLPSVERKTNPDHWWTRRYPLHELAGELRALKPEVRCMVNDFRDYAFQNNGLPVEETELKDIAETFRFTKYRFLRFWNGDEAKGIKGAKNFFTQIEGRLYYAWDLQQTTNVIDISQKQRENGRKGAEALWEKRRKEKANPMDGDPIDSPLASVEAAAIGPLAVAVGSNSVEEGSEGETTAETPPPAENFPPAYPRARSAIASRFPGVDAKFMEKLGEAARHVIPEINDPLLEAAIRDCYQENQISAGLFLTTVPAYLENLKRSAKDGPPLESIRKPATKEEENRERDRLLEATLRKNFAEG